MLHYFPKIGIVVPCYNEAMRLSCDEFKNFFERFPQIHFCFVNDGSLDNTNELLNNLTKKRENHVKVISLEQNKGKAEAVRQGINYLLSCHPFFAVGYWDADLATPLDEIFNFVNILRQSSSSKFVCGSRVRFMGVQIERTPIRHYLGRIFATVAAIYLCLPIYDTQCGAKLITAELSKEIFNKPFISKWLFDIELIIRAIMFLGFKETKQAIVEVPLKKWQDKLGSKLTPYHYARVPSELIKIFCHYRRPWHKVATNYTGHF